MGETTRRDGSDGPLTPQDLSRVAPYIDGQSVQSEGNDHFPAYDPASGRELCQIPAGTPADIDKAVASARANFSRTTWRGMPPSAKKAIMHRWADLIEAAANRLNALDALEMGKPTSLAMFDARYAAGLVRFNAEAIDKVSGDVLTSDASSTVVQKWMPRGVVGAIIPWNFPSYNAVLKAAPALAAGNSVILKPSELSSQSVLLLAALAVEAGLPPGVLNVVPGIGSIVGKALAEHMDVDMVAFTGSSEVGKLILRYSGDSNMKLVSAECGGKSPHIVFDDNEDLKPIARSIAQMLLLNQGQVCSVGSRLLVHEAIADDLVQEVVDCLSGFVVGDPQNATTNYGPLVSREQLNKVLRYIETAIAEGADLVHGGERILTDSGGYFIEPSVFVNVDENNPIGKEEIFGPVLSVTTFNDLEGAIRLANATSYGLAAYIWTSRLDTGFKLGNTIGTAVTMINGAAIAGEGPGHAFSGEPFGQSGFGVEGGMAGLETYMRRQTLWINHG